MSAPTRQSKQQPDGALPNDDTDRDGDLDISPPRKEPIPTPDSSPQPPLPESHDSLPGRVQPERGRITAGLFNLGRALGRGPIAVIDGFGDTSGPWLTDGKRQSGIAESWGGSFDTANHRVLTTLDLAGRIAKKFAAMILLRFMRIPSLRAIAQRIFRFGIWSEAMTKFAGFYEIIGVFTHNRIGSVEFFRKLLWSIFVAAGSFATAAAIEIQVVAPLLIFVASLGCPIAVLTFVVTPLLACLTFFVSDYAVRLVGSLLYTALNPAVSNAANGIIHSFLSLLSRVFSGSSSEAPPAARSSKGRAPINIRAKRSRTGRRFRRILPPPSSEPRRWWPGRRHPNTTGNGPSPEPPAVPISDEHPLPSANGSTEPSRRRKPRRTPISRPRVGGVLFDHCDEVLTGIEEITGAYRDPATGALVLVGKASANEDPLELSLAPADLDHMFVALRAAIMGEAMGVSIDPPAQYRYSEDDGMLPDKSPLLISYLGGCAGTLAGAIFFEADRIMKCLSIGQDNCKGGAFSSKVPGYESTFDMRGVGSRTGSSRHRFWFVVDLVEIKKSADGDGFVFGDVKIAVKTELQIHGGAAGEKIDPDDAQFAAHLSNHFDEYANEFPVFARLKELGKVAAIATFFANQLGPMDWGALLDAQATPVETPNETPSILRSGMRQQGRILYTRMVSGGVDMNVMLHHKFESIGEASRLRRLAAESRPAAAPQWDFADGASRLRATAVPMAAGTIFRPVEPDHQFDHDLGTPPDFALRRIYLGAGSTHGLCGPGWDIFVPYSLSISVPLGKRPETLDPKISAASSQAQGVIFLKEAETGAAYVYRKITHKSATGDPCWALVRPILMGNENRSLEYHPTDCIYWRDNHYVVRRGREYHFDGSGRLMEVFSGKTLVARYKWNVDRLDSIEDGLGRRYSLSFNPADQRFDGVVISDGQTIDYRYGPDGSLLEVKVNDRVNSQYGYDTIGRLTETIGSDGRVTARATYNAASLLSNHTGSDDVRTEDGDVIKRYLDNGRIDLVRDQHGAKASFLYFGTGHLTSITVTSSAKETWRFEYGANRTLKRVIDPFGRIAETRINCHGHSSCRSDRVG